MLRFLLLTLASVLFHLVWACMNIIANPEAILADLFEPYKFYENYVDMHNRIIIS